MLRPAQHSKSNKPTKQLASLAAQLAKLSAEMVELATTFLAQTSPTASPSESEAGKSLVASIFPTGPQRPTPASKDEVLASVKAARDVIGQYNQPVHISILYKEVRARGYVINTSQPISTYGARLRDHKDRVGLTHLDGFGWWLKERPYPAANHTAANVTRIGKHSV